MSKLSKAWLPWAVLFLILISACGGASNVPTPTTKPSDADPIDSSKPTMTLKVSPIQSTAVRVSEGVSQDYSVLVISTLPMGSSCSEFKGYEIKQMFPGLVDIEITHLEVDTSQLEPAVECTADLPIIDTLISLGTGEDLGVGERYTVKVNGEISAEFLVRDPEGPKMTITPAPIQQIRIDESGSQPRQYRLNVVYTQPIGSSCSDFNGFAINRPSSNLFEVTLTNLEVAEEGIPCTDDLPSGEVTILLGSVGTNLVAGEEYEVVVNDQMTDTFAAR